MKAAITKDYKKQMRRELCIILNDPDWEYKPNLVERKEEIMAFLDFDYAVQDLEDDEKAKKYLLVTNLDVTELEFAYLSGMQQKEVGFKFKVPYYVIRYVAKRDKWSDKKKLITKLARKEQRNRHKRKVH